MVSRRPRVSLLLAAALLAAACSSRKSTPQAMSARPVPSPRGGQIGSVSAFAIGPAGGTFTSPDVPATVTVTVPAGALAASVDLTIVPITSTAPGSVGTTAWRLGPEGTVFLSPVTLEFLVKDAALDLNTLTVASQDGSGYWVRYQEVVRDLAGRKLRVTTNHFSDWAIVTGTSARDLRGAFTLSSTAGVPLAATGAAFLDFAGEDAEKVYYLLWGSITLSSSSVVIGSSTCTPDAPTTPLPTNVAEVTKGQSRFDWGVSGHWSLTCTSGGAPAPAQILTTAFDTVGLSLTGCARSYAGTPLVGPDHVASGGAYTVTCGAPPPAQTVTWDFVNSSCGSSCTAHPDPVCHTGVVDCSSGSAVCVDGPPVANGTSCNDGNACTQTDSCQAGVCTGANPVVCTALDQCHDAGVCNTATGVCSTPAKLDGTACNDGNACTSGDVCTLGVCAGLAPVLCGALDQCHDVGVCDPATGCPNPPKADGTACNDGNACTQADTCQAGVCTGSSPVVCTALDQCHDAGVCDGATGLCTSPAKTDGTACNDGNACTQTDTCVGGTCTGASPVVCAALDQCHDAGVCDTATGACSTPAKTDGTACNDGNACTGTDTCVGGVCTGASPVVCTALDECHDAGVCDAATGTCSNPPKLDGTLCTGGACLGGTCARTVAGPRLVTYWTDAGAQAPVVPADASPAALQRATVAAYVPDAGGRRIDGTVDALGGYAIPGVPVGRYLLVVTDGDGRVQATQTTSSSVDLGWDVLGRPSATPAAAGTALAIAVTGLDSWDPVADQLQLTSADADVWDPAIRGAQLSSTSGTWTEDWAASAAGGPLDLLAAADVLWAHHLAKRTTGGAPAYDYLSATFALSPASLDMTALTTQTLPVDFPPGTPAAVSQSGAIDVASWDLPSFESWLSAMAPSPNPPGAAPPGPVHALRVAASIHALASPAPVPRNGSPDLLLLQVPVPPLPATSAVIAGPGAMPYGQFLPARWLEWLGVDFAATQSYLLAPATSSLVVAVSMGSRQPQPTPAALALGPTLSPPAGIQISLGPVPAIGWTAPALGTPTSYTVELYRLQVSGTATTSTRVAVLSAGHQPAGPQGIALPPGLLASGASYYARVTAHAGSPDPFDTQPLRRANVGTWAGALTAAFVAP